MKRKKKQQSEKRKEKNKKNKKIKDNSFSIHGAYFVQKKNNSFCAKKNENYTERFEEDMR
jgi:hypothetical protein